MKNKKEKKNIIGGENLRRKFSLKDKKNKKEDFAKQNPPKSKTKTKKTSI